MIKKNILLLNDNSNFKAIATLKNNNVEIDNLNIPKGNYFLLVLQNENVILKVETDLFNNNQFFINNINLNSNIQILICEVFNDSCKEIVWGFANCNDFSLYKLLNIANKCLVNCSCQKENCILENKEKLFCDDDVELNNLINLESETALNEVCKEDINCLHNEESAFACETETLKDVALKNDVGIIGVKENETLKNDENLTFIEILQEQLQDIFNNYKPNEELQNLIPNSKWVTVDYNNDNNKYVLGIIYEDQISKYICYGVPSNKDGFELDGMYKYAQWLPLSNDNFEGYYLMYQNALTGEQISFEN